MPVEYGLTTTGFFALTVLVALDALLGVVAGLAFLDDDLDAADAAVALVEHRQIVVHAVGDRDARAGEGAGAVGEQRHVDACPAPAPAATSAGSADQGRQAAPRTRCFNASRSSLRICRPWRRPRRLTISRRPTPPGVIPPRRPSSARRRELGQCAPSVGKRPHPQFLLPDLPQPRQAVRLDDQEEDDQRADDHEGAGARRSRQLIGDAEASGQRTQQDRQAQIRPRRRTSRPGCPARR